MRACSYLSSTFSTLGAFSGLSHSLRACKPFANLCQAIDRLSDVLHLSDEPLPCLDHGERSRVARSWINSVGADCITMLGCVPNISRKTKLALQDTYAVGIRLLILFNNAQDLTLNTCFSADYVELDRVTGTDLRMRQLPLVWDRYCGARL